MLQKLKNLQRVIELSTNKVGLNTVEEIIKEFEEIQNLPNYDLLFEAFKEGNSYAMMPEDDWETIDLDFRKWYDDLKKKYDK